MRAENSLLLTDLYQLTMLHGYWTEGMDAEASFELFVRVLPRERNFLVAAGLEQALAFLEQARFQDAELEWLRATRWFPEGFVEHLAALTFRGEVHALPEGTVFFADEPLLRVTAPIAQAQLLESRLINILHLQTVLASKAVRCRLAAPGKRLVDFGLRRAHGAEAGLLAARASYLTGYDGSSTVLAGARFGIPVFGTMAHSYIEAHDDEAAAFEGFARARRRDIVLLIDTYDTERGADKVAALASRLEGDGIRIAGVRLDSGDLAEHARRVRAVLDRAGLTEVRIFASGGLDERQLAVLERQGAPIDGYGVGTRVDVSADAPYLDCAFKLTEYAGQPRRKQSEGKATWPGRKQVYRRFDERGQMAGDVITVEGDHQTGQPLLQPVMREGRRLAHAEPLEVCRQRLAEQLAGLPSALKVLQPAPPYPVEIAPALHRLAAEADRRRSS